MTSGKFLASKSASLGDNGMQNLDQQQSSSTDANGEMNGFMGSRGSATAPSCAELYMTSDQTVLSTLWEFVPMTQVRICSAAPCMNDGDVRDAAYSKLTQYEL